MTTFIHKPNWSNAFEGATHVVMLMRLQGVYAFATKDTHDNYFDQYDNELHNFKVIEERPALSVEYDSMFSVKPLWSHSWEGATHIIRMNDLIEEKRIYHFAKQDGALLKSFNGTVFADYEIIDVMVSDTEVRLSPAQSVDDLMKAAVESLQPRKYYIAGPMSGLDGLNREAFYEECGRLEYMGHSVLIPAILPDGFTQREYMIICYAMMQCVTHIFMLKGWESSFGARAEHASAVKFGLVIEYQE